ncbi:hypothetical protein HF086_018318 [Spodoptera exigua]|uniref:SV2-like protein 1 n=1 Tax=Spodoptera exigua TaxID=7107 RepID=A0A922M1P6_SPOEX|nr:hypothetical protein HF086_018318 [Spodoptera exigua]
MTFVTPETLSKKTTYENALDLTGFGKYNAGMLIACCLLILSMNLDMFGFSVVLPAMACDMALDTSQQGLLSAIPLIGMIVSSYGWGLCSDTQGRRKTLLIAMPAALILSLATTMAPTFALLAIFKFFSVSLTTNFESIVQYLITYFLLSAFALPIFTLTFGYEISWLGLVYTPWRMLLQIVCIPCALGIIFMIFLQESPKYLLSRGRDEEALKVLKIIYEYNSGENMENYPVKEVYLNETTADNSAGISLLKKIWNQTAPLFKPPLLKNSAILFYLLLSAFTTSTGFTMWVPTMTNAYFTGDESHHGRTFCEVASQSATTGSSNGTEIEDCSNSIQTGALYATMVYSGVSTMLMVTISFIVGIVGKKIITLAIFVMSFTAGTLLLFVKVPMLSIALFFMFLYVAQVLGNINTYLVELNPTHLRSMATCLAVVIARGSGFFSVQIIANLLGEYCTPMISGYIVLVMSGFVVATFLPSESKLKSISQGEQTHAEDAENPKD